MKNGKKIKTKKNTEERGDIRTKKCQAGGGIPERTLGATRDTRNLARGRQQSIIGAHTTKTSLKKRTESSKR